MISSIWCNFHESINTKRAHINYFIGGKGLQNVGYPEHFHTFCLIVLCELFIFTREYLRFKQTQSVKGLMAVCGIKSVI